MHLLRHVLTILMLSMAIPSVFAQPTTGSITGKLVDAKNQAVSYATVTLLRSDSSVANGDLSKEDGSFNIANTGMGSFLLRIESIGYTTRFVNVQLSEAQPDKNMGNIQLAQTENTLKDVSIVGERPIMELKVDKKVFNVEKNTTTAGGSAADVLQNVPSVSVDADGNVSLRGKGDVTILIDGKPATMLGSDVASALQSLSASSIESVEVLTNPSAKYDAQGTTGIINIITKKDGRLGINGNVSLGAGTRDKYNGNFGLNIRKGKWNVFMNSNLRLNSTFNNVTTTRNDKDSVNHNLQSYRTYEHVPRHFDGNFNTVGVSFDPDKYNSITVTENINLMQFSFADNSSYKVYDQLNQLGNKIYDQDRNSTFSGGPFSLSSAVDYKHKFKKKDEELSVDLTYATTEMQRYQDYTTFISSDTVLRESAPGTGSNQTLNVWADYTDPLFTKNGKLGMGFKSQLYWFNSSNNPIMYINDISNGTKFDSGLKSDYNYTQQTNAAYVNWNDQMGKFGYQAGLRFEDAQYNGHGAVPRDTSFKNTFTNLFPSAFVSYQLANQQSIYLNYSRRTNRPGFMQLLPFVDRSNPGTINTGNPNLIPEFINNVEFSYSKSDKKGNNFIFSAYYAYTQNLNQRVTRNLKKDEAARFGEDTTNLITQPINIASGVTYGVEGTGHVQILPIWDATINLNAFQNELNIGDIDTVYKNLSNTSGFSWFGKVNTNLKLPKNFSLQVNGNYESAKVIAQGNLKETYWVDVALKKTFWKNKATLVLNCSDIFKTHILVTNYDYSNFYETINRVRETRIGNINFTYRFGKSDVGKTFANGKGGKPDKGGDSLKPVKPNDEDRMKNLKDGDDNDPGGGGQGGAPGGGQKKAN